MNRPRVLATVAALVVAALGVGALVLARQLSAPAPDCALADRISIDGDAALVSDADGIGVYLQRDDGFTVGALFWILRIGDTEFYRSVYPEFATTTIEFDLPDEALPGLRDGDAISIRYGTPAFQPGAPDAGWGPAPSEIAAVAALGVLHMAEECPN